MNEKEIVAGLSADEVLEIIRETNKLVDSDDVENHKQAVEVYLKISELYPESLQCKHALGICYESGRGIEQDIEKAKTYFRQAAFLGSVLSKQSLAYILLKEENSESVMLLESIVNDPKAKGSAVQLNAIAMLAAAYWNGKLVEKNAEKSIEYYEICLEQKHLIGMFNYARILVSLAKGKPENIGKASDICRFIVSKNQTETTVDQEARKLIATIDTATNANLVKGLNLLLGTEKVEKNVELGIKLLEYSSASGNPEASYYLGKLYYLGKDVERDYDKAFDCFMLSYDRGSKKALNYLSIMRGIGKVSDDAMKTEKIAYEYYKKLSTSEQYHVIFDYILFWGNNSMRNPHEVYRVNSLCKIILDKCDDKRYKEVAREMHKKIQEFIDDAYTDALACLGFIEGAKVNFELGIDLLKTATVQGHKDAPCHLGKHYLITEEDYLKAYHYLKLAQERKCEDADYFLGLMYAEGKGIPKNPQKAIECLEAVVKRKHRKTESEEHEYKTALNLVATIYGRDLNDRKTAFKYWKKAAKLDIASAQINLSVEYHEGVVVKRDGQEALYWAIKAKENGSENADALIEAITNEII